MKKGQCESYKDCNGHGDCVNSICTCDMGWFGDICEHNGIDKWGLNVWKSVLIIYSVLYFILFAVALKKLFFSLYNDKHLGFYRLLVRMFRSPKHLSLFFISLIGLLRGVWLSVDPLSFDNKMSRLGDRFLYEIIYAILYGLYTCVLLVWGGLYQGMTSKRSDPFRILRRVLLWIMISAFPVVITLSIIKGNRISDDLVFIIGSIFVGIGISILIIGFIVFLILLFLYVDTNMKPEMGELTFQRGSIQDDIKLLQSRSLKREDFIKPSNTFRRMSVIFEVNDSNSNIPKLNDATSLEFEITNSNRLDTSWNSYLSELESQKSDRIIRNTSRNLIFKTPTPSKHDINSHYILNLTKEDRIVFRKIIVLSSLSALLGIVILILYIGFAASAASNDPNIVLSAVYISFSLEIFSCVMIYIVFTTQIKVSAKERLQFVTRIAIEKSNKEAVISYPKSLSHIGDKLYYYF